MVDVFQFSFKILLTAFGIPVKGSANRLAPDSPSEPADAAVRISGLAGCV